MCGIIGIISRRDVGGMLVEGLKNLEYRGYDSAGFAVVKEHDFLCYKNAGRVAQLDDHVDEANGGHIGIAHTRWATHGPPTEINAHPHLDRPARSRWSTTGSSKTTASLRVPARGQGITFTRRPTPRCSPS